MKIAICMSWFGDKPTGVGKSLIYLFEAIAKNFPNIEIVVFSGKKQANLQLPFPAKRIIFSNRLFGRLILRFRLRNCDFIHYHNNGWIIKNQNSKKSVFMIHDVLPLMIPNYFSSDQSATKYRNTIQNALDTGAIILTVSKYSQQEIINHFNCSRPINVLYNGVTVPQIVAPVTRGDYYMYNGGYERRKGQADLLRSFINSDVKRRLIFVGQQLYHSDEFKKLVDIAKEKGILTELGYVTDRKLSELVANARALIYPSKFEGFGLPVIEAMMLGTPVLTSPFMSLPEICGDAALYFDHEKEGELEKLLTMIESKPEILDQMSQKGRRRAVEFSWDRAAFQYIDILQKHCDKE